MISDVTRRSVQGVVSLVLVLSGCEGPGGAAVDALGTHDAIVPADDVDAQSPHDGASDAEQGDMSDGESIADASGDADGDVDPADATADSVSPNACPGGHGCPCEAHSDCNAALCIDTPEGMRCALPCAAGCPEGFLCGEVTSPGGQPASVCVSRFARLCDPCASTGDCKTVGVEGGACVDQLAGGAFCGVACATSADCPQGYACQDAVSVEKIKSLQCVRLPSAGDSGAFGVCPCSPWATAKGLSTACYQAVKTADDKTTGTCTGQRTCLSGGLSACDAPAAVTETCDGKDNDCNGKTDDLSCDDGNPCTNDGCDMAKGCTQVAVDGLPCDADGSACTTADACKGGLCVAGPKSVCDDQSPCTTDSCDPKTGTCAVQPVEGDTPCSDDNPCTVGDKCLAGECTAGPPKDCQPGTLCQVATCDPTKNGACVVANKPEGTACDDGDACTASDGCQGGTCTGAKGECQDNNLCTDDSCGAVAGCVYAPNGVTCSDDNGCTQGDVCKDKACHAGEQVICNDGEHCTIDSCDSKAGACVYAALPMAGTPCNADDSVCTVEDTCKGGKCAAGKVLTCDDDNACSTDLCHPVDGCKHVANAEPCDADGSVCTVADACKDKACVAGPELDCDDGNLCTTEVCGPQSGCGSIANTLGCDADGSACTVGDTCAAKSCVAGTLKPCDDDNLCTADGCDAKTGACVADGSALAGKDCDADGSVCTVGDACAAGKCSAGGAKNCNDGNPCTDDGCDAKLGCSAVANAAPCDADGSACTSSDACVGKQCVAGPAKPCNDGNPCTADGCDPLTAKCTAVQLKDDEACGPNSICKAGVCKLKGPSYFGDGSTGNLAVGSGAVQVNGYAYMTSNASKGTSYLSVDSATPFSVGDEIMIHQVQHAVNAGQYEFHRVVAKGDTTLQLDAPLDATYESGKFNMTGAVATQVIRVPHYANVTVAAGASIVAREWDGKVGAVVVFRASGTVTVNGAVAAVGAGFRTGAMASCGKSGYQGEGYKGMGGISTAENAGGGGGSTSAGTCGDSGAGGSGGGGHGAPGGTGAKCGKGCGTTAGGSGGSAFGMADLVRLLPGGGAGSNGRDDNCGNYGTKSCVACGSDGGGIVRIMAAAIDVSGKITADGEDNNTSSGQDSIGPASGAGGSIHLSAKQVSLGTAKVSAVAGAPGKTHWCTGGVPAVGGVGRIRVDRIDSSGTTSPTALVSNLVAPPGYVVP